MQRIISWAYITLLIIVLLLFIAFGYVDILGKVVAFLCVMSAFSLVYRAYRARNVLLLVIFAFMALYAWPSKLFFFDGVMFSIYNLDPNYVTSFWVTVVLSFFFAILNLYVKFNYKSSFVCPSFYCKNNKLFWGIYFISLVSIFVFRPRGNLYAGGEDVSVSSLYEYVLILFLALYIFSNNERKKMASISILFVLYTIFTILSGARVSIVMLGLLLIVMIYQFKLKVRYALLFLLLVVWIMNVYGNIRSNPTILLEGNILNIVNPFERSELIDYQNSNEGDVYWASERLFILSKEGELTIMDRLESLFYFVISPISIGSSLPPVANLTQFKTEVYGTGGGALAPIVFYMFGGFIGVFLLAMFVGKTINRLQFLDGSLLSNYSILLYVMVPRWFVYFPIPLIKFCVIGCLFIYLIRMVGRRKKCLKRT